LTLDRLCADRPVAITSVQNLSGAIEAFIDGWNERCHPFVWTKTQLQVAVARSALITRNPPNSAP
jgi:hypothetical protein